MMRLIILSAHRWRVFAECDRRGTVDVVDQISRHMTGNYRKSAAALVGLIDRCAQHGPRSLPPNLSHECGQGIWEFIKGDLRLLYFVADDSVVVCSHLFLKKRQKTPGKEVDRAARLRDRYRAAEASGDLQELRGDEDVFQTIRRDS